MVPQLEKFNKIDIFVFHKIDGMVQGSAYVVYRYICNTYFTVHVNFTSSIYSCSRFVRKPLKDCHYIARGVLMMIVCLNSSQGLINCMSFLCAVKMER
jgi:hypothetical protein